MTLSLVAYANFPSGQTREAMTYYQQVFGGALDVSTFGDAGMEGAPPDGVMHAHLATEYFSLMASDAMPGSEDTWGGTRIYLALMGDDAETLNHWFDTLAADGSVGMPLQQTSWGATFGLLKDKYGLEWMVNISGAQG